MELGQYWRSLRSGWWLLLLGLLVGGLAAGAVLYTTDREYTTNTRMFVSTTGNTDLTSAVQGSQFAQERITSYAAYLTDQQVMAAVVEDLDLSMSPDELAGMIAVDVPAGTVILNITVTAESPDRAVDIGRSLGRQFPRLLRELETPEGSSTSPVKVTVTAQPQRPTSPSSPDPVLDLAAGLALGLLVGAAVAILRDRLDTRIRTSDDAAAAAGAPALGVVVQDSQLAADKVFSADAPSATAEEFRQLMTNLDFLDVDRPPRAIVVSSATADEGKTTVAVNLATLLAHSGRSVVLVEADLRRPRVTRYLGLVSGAGLTHVLNGSAEYHDVRQSVYGMSLSVLGAGPRPPSPGDLLSSDQMRTLIEQLKSEHDFVLIDSPPVLPVADTTRLATLVDGVLLCVRWGRTRREQVEQAQKRLGRVNARVLGVIMTMTPRRVASKEGIGSPYGYPYDDDRPQVTVPKAPLRREILAGADAERTPSSDDRTVADADAPARPGAAGASVPPGAGGD